MYDLDLDLEGGLSSHDKFLFWVNPGLAGTVRCVQHGRAYDSGGGPSANEAGQLPLGPDTRTPSVVCSNLLSVGMGKGHKGGLLCGIYCRCKGFPPEFMFQKLCPCM